MRPRYLLTLLTFLLAAFLPPLDVSAQAPGPGLLLTETFENKNLIDTAKTNANWSTEEQALIMAWRQAKFGAFGQGLTTANIPNSTQATTDIVAGDIDGDGDKDLIVINGVKNAQPGTPLESNQLFLNTSSGSNITFGNAINLPNSKNPSIAGALADVNNDGRLDLIVGNFGTENKLYLGNGNPNQNYFSAPVNISNDKDHTLSVAVGDLNQDGLVDLVVGNSAAAGTTSFEPNKLYLGNKNAATNYFSATAISITDERFNTQAVRLGDMDNDGDLDLMTGNMAQPNLLYINKRTATNKPANPFEGVGNGLVVGVTPPAGTAAANATWDIELADMDSDGDLDLVAGNIGLAGTAGAAPNMIYLNNVVNPARVVFPIPFYNAAGTASTVVGTAFNGDPLSDTRTLAVGDVDGDGDLDVVAGNVDIRPAVLGLANNLYVNNGAGGLFLWNTQISVGIEQTISLLLEDMNRDSQPDLVVGNLTGQVNKVLVNNASINPFASSPAQVLNYLNPAPPPLPGMSTSFAVGDINLDGFPDLVVGVQNGSDEIWYHNQTTVAGANVFANAVGPVNPNNPQYVGAVFPPGAMPALFNATSDVELADVDRDGDLDLVQSGAANQWWLNDNCVGFPCNNFRAAAFGGAFGPVGTTSSSIAVGDINRDGWVDVAVANVGAPNAWHANAQGPPYFGAAVSTITNENFGTLSIELADMNNDGWLDVVAGNSTNISRLYIANRPTANAPNPLGSPSASNIDTGESNNTSDIAVGDVNDDGWLDVVLGNLGKNRLFLNNGSGAMTQPGIDVTADADQTAAIALGDVNQDGRLDLLAGNSVNNNLNLANKLYLGSAASPYFKALAPSDRFPSTLSPTFAVALADMDKSGGLDMLVGNNNVSDQFFPNLSFIDPSSDPFMAAVGRNLTAAALAGNVTAMVAGDIDKDGKEDVVVAIANQPNQLFTYKAMKAANFLNVTGTAIGTKAENTQDVKLADINRDGWLDIVVANQSADNYIYLNRKDKTPNPTHFDDNNRQAISAGDTASQSTSIAAGDINRDGWLDIVVGNNGQNNRLYLNAAPAATAASQVYFPQGAGSGQNIGTATEKTMAIALGDINLNGWLDIVVGNFENNPNRWHLNTQAAAGYYTNAAGGNDSRPTDKTMSVALADMNNDGWLDMVTGNQLQPNQLYLNTTNLPSGFGPPNPIAADSRDTQTIILANLDNDSDIDVISGNVGGPNRVYLNTGIVPALPPLPVIPPLIPTFALGVNVSSETSNTAAMLVADINSDGKLDMLADQANQLRFYERRIYNSISSQATSIRVDNQTSNIAGATLDYSDKTKQPKHVAADFWMSNNGGTNWFNVQLGKNLNFPTTGMDLRWRVDLYSRSPIASPLIDTLTIGQPAAVTLQGNGQPITNGAAATAAAGTDFGATPAGGTGTPARAFTINNTGARNLTINVAATGPNAADFLVTAGTSIVQASTVQASAMSTVTLNINAGQSGTFNVIFKPTGVGERAAKISITSPTDAQLTFEFNIKGSGQAVPAIKVLGSDSSTIADGSTAVSPANGTDFGTVKLGESVEKSFTLTNTGTAALNLTGTPRIKFSPDNGTFSIKNLDQLPASIASKASAPFTIVFNPQNANLADATVIIESNAGDGSYSFKVRGTTTTEANAEVRGTNGVAIANGENAPDSAKGTDMGDVTVNGTPVKKTLTIANTGTGPLSVTGIASSQPNDFTILSLAQGANVPVGGSVSFDVQFRPTAVGDRTAQITVSSNDPDTPAYTFIIKGKGLQPGSIAVTLKGSNVIVTKAGTIDFGPVSTTAEPAVKTLVIANGGGAELTLVAPSLDAGQGDFGVGTLSVFSVPPGASTELNLTFSPSSLGTKTGKISIRNSDPDNNPFEINLTGEGVAPAMVVKDATGATLASSDAVGGASGTVNFGSVIVESATKTVVLSIENPGKAPLQLSGTPAVVVSGAQAAEFGVVSQPTATIAPSSTVTFTISFDPSELGPRTAQLSIPSNASAQLLTINMEGKGAAVPAPVLDLTYGSGNMAIGPATTVQFSNAVVGSDGVTEKFTVQNSGTAPLTINSLSLSGDAAAEFTHTLAAPITVEAGKSATFDMTFNPFTAGNRSAVVRLDHNDTLRAAFTFIIQGTGDPAPSPSMEINVGGVGVEDGSSSTSSANGTDFGDAVIGAQGATRTYKVCNNGTAPMAVTKLEIVGATDEFVADLETPQSVAVGECLDVTVSFTPKFTGERVATISIRYTTGTVNGASQVKADALGGEEKTFTFTVRGNGAVSPAPEVEVRGNGTPINAGDTSPSLGDRTDFGSVTVNSAPVIQTFTIHNLGTAEMTLSGDPVVAIGGDGASDFTVTSLPGSVVPAGGSTSMSISFAPQSIGGRTAAVSIASNDADEPTYSFAIQGKGLAVPEPEIDVSGQVGNMSVSIISGDSSPQTSDKTDFGIATIGFATEPHQFVIRNGGTAALNLTGEPVVQIAGDAAGDFTASQPKSTVEADGIATFNIIFAPTTEGERVAQVVIASNDSDEATYQFTIRGFGEAEPEPSISVQSGLAEIADEDETPSVFDGTDFGAAVVGLTEVANMFAIFNNGTAPLLLTGFPAVAIAGANPEDFFVSIQPSEFIDAGSGFTTFEVVFSPTALGTRTAVISIENNDDSPFYFTVQGEGLSAPAPEIDVANNGTSIANDDETPSISDGTDFGEVGLGDSVDSAFSILNYGSANLTISDNVSGTKVLIDGPNAGDFQLVKAPDGVVAPGSGSTTFSIRFTPSADGIHQAVVSILSDDEDESPFSFTIRGTGQESRPFGTSVGMLVRARNFTIVANDSTPTSRDGTLVGAARINSGRAVEHFTIVNQGSLDVRLTGQPLVTISGSHAADFAVTQLTQGDTVGANGGTFGFTIVFTPKATGQRTATVTIASTDPVEPSYTFSIAGFGSSVETFLPLTQQ